MTSTLRRDFLKSLVALPALGAVCTVRAGAEYELTEFPVAGLPYHVDEDGLSGIEPGDALILVREPDNPHDANAIRIEAAGRQVGYVPRSENLPLVRLMDQGVELRARVKSVAPAEWSWHAVTVAVRMRLPVV
ncbi:MAG: HIRAN domain-containing protein [Gammaproteobacteria bacterium]